MFFNERKSFVRYHGEVRYVDHEWFRTSDGSGNPRNAIRFVLEEVAEPDGAVQHEASPPVQRPPTTTERRGLVTSRVGQGYYRQQLLDKFDWRCAVTSCTLAEVLIASHIVPWRSSTDAERLDVENGILLSPAYDALFDRNLISFDDEGAIILSPLLGDTQITDLGIDPNAKICISEGMRPFLVRHREKLR